MKIKVTCPECRASQSVSDKYVGQTVQCNGCQAEFVPAPVTPAPRRAARRFLTWIIGLVVLFLLVLGGAIAIYLYLDIPTQTDFTDPNGVFSARFPNEPVGTTVREAKPIILVWGERHYVAKVKDKEYSVAILDGLNTGEQLYGPATRDNQINGLVVIAILNAGGKQIFERPADHEGHSARDVVFAYRQGGKLTAMRVFVGEQYGLRLMFTAPGDADNPAEFLDGASKFFADVHPGAAFGPPVVNDPPAVSAMDLASAYQADAGAADAKYKDRWLRITGSVRDVTKEKADFTIAAGDSVIVVRRPPEARLTVPVRASGAVVMTAKCRGLDAGADGRRIVVDEAIVASAPARK